MEELIKKENDIFDILQKFIDAKLEFIKRHSKICPKMYKDFRRGLISRFPFGIYYTIERKRIVVFAVLDLRQNPENIRSRLTKED